MKISCMLKRVRRVRERKRKSKSLLEESWTCSYRDRKKQKQQRSWEDSSFTILLWRDMVTSSVCGRIGRDVHFLTSFFPLRFYVVSSSGKCHILRHIFRHFVLGVSYSCEVMIVYLDKTALWKLVREHFSCLVPQENIFLSLILISSLYHIKIQQYTKLLCYGSVFWLISIAITVMSLR